MNKNDITLDLNKLTVCQKQELPKVGDIGVFISMYNKRKVGVLISNKNGYIDSEGNLYSEFEPLPTELQEQLKKYL